MEDIHIELDCKNFSKEIIDKVKNSIEDLEINFVPKGTIIITPEQEIAKDIKVFYKGKEIRNCVELHIYPGEIKFR